MENNPVSETGGPVVGSQIYITIRSRCTKVGPEMIQVELEELLANKTVKEPVYMWCPTNLVTKQTLATNTVVQNDVAK